MYSLDIIKKEKKKNKKKKTTLHQILKTFIILISIIVSFCLKHSVCLSAIYKHFGKNAAQIKPFYCWHLVLILHPNYFMGQNSILAVTDWFEITLPMFWHSFEIFSWDFLKPPLEILGLDS